jgi:LisH domain-containing protein ARMC9
MIEWIVNVIWNEMNTLSEYSLEYATALLMNLTLWSAGKNACEDWDLKVLSLLNDLIEHENF